MLAWVKVLFTGGVVGLALCLPTVSQAEFAEVLPQGKARVIVDTHIYFPTSQRYNPEGEVEDVATDYNAVLTSRIFPALTQLERAFGMAPGTACLGRSVVSFSYQFKITNTYLQYGVTDNLSVGVMIPYWWVRNRVKSYLDISHATVGKNARFNILAPLRVPGTVPLTSEDIRSLLGGGLDINGDGRVDIKGFGFKRFQPWYGEGLSDIEAGFRYQYLHTDQWRLAFTGGARFPTGRLDDPNDLTDYPFGRGVYALLFRLNNDFIGIKGLVLNATVKYDLNLPHTQLVRVPDSVNNPLTSNIERVSFDIGDVLEFEHEGKYEFYRGWIVNWLYRYGMKLEDQAVGRKAFFYKSLEMETDYTEHVAMIGLSYSTYHLYAEKRFPLPLKFGVYYRNRFAGSNNVLQSEYIGVGMQAVF